MKKMKIVALSAINIYLHKNLDCFDLKVRAISLFMLALRVCECDR